MLKRPSWQMIPGAPLACNGDRALAAHFSGIDQYATWLTAVRHPQIPVILRKIDLDQLPSTKQIYLTVRTLPFTRALQVRVLIGGEPLLNTGDSYGLPAAVDIEVSSDGGSTWSNGQVLRSPSPLTPNGDSLGQEQWVATDAENYTEPAEVGASHLPAPWSKTTGEVVLRVTLSNYAYLRALWVEPWNQDNDDLLSAT